MSRSDCSYFYRGAVSVDYYKYETGSLAAIFLVKRDIPELCSLPTGVWRALWSSYSQSYHNNPKHGKSLQCYKDVGCYGHGLTVELTVLGEWLDSVSKVSFNINDSVILYMCIY